MIENSVLVLFALYLAVTCIGCKENESGPKGIQVINPSLSNAHVALHDLVDTLIYIPLEETSESYIAGIRHADYSKESFIIKDFNSESLFFFDNNGNYQFTEYPKGNGPLEYNEVTCFTVNRKTNTLIISDRSNRRIYEYNLNTKKIVSEYPIDHMLFSLMPDGDDYLALAYDPENGYLKKFNREGSMKGSDIFLPDYFNMAPGGKPFVKYKNHFYLNAAFSDTIYRIDGHTAIPIAALGEDETSISQFSTSEELGAEIIFKSRSTIQMAEDPILISKGHFLIHNSTILLPTLNKKWILWNMDSNDQFLITPANIENAHLIGDPIVQSIFSDSDEWIYSVIIHIDDRFWDAIDSAPQSHPFYEMLRNASNIEGMKAIKENPVIVKMKLKEDFIDLFD